MSSDPQRMTPQELRLRVPPHIRKSEHLPALSALLDAVALHEPDVPCRSSGNPNLWLSTDPTDVFIAAAGCQRCPVLEICAAYLERYPEPTGTWAGQSPPSHGHARGSLPRPRPRRNESGEVLVPRMKVCDRCALAKHSSEFGHSEKSRDGLKTLCAECRAEARRQAEARALPRGRKPKAREPETEQPQEREQPRQRERAA